MFAEKQACFKVGKRLEYVALEITFMPLVEFQARWILIHSNSMIYLKINGIRWNKNCRIQHSVWVLLLFRKGTYFRLVNLRTQKRKLLSAKIFGSLILGICLRDGPTTKLKANLMELVASTDFIPYVRLTSPVSLLFSAVLTTFTLTRCSIKLVS